MLTLLIDTNYIIDRFVAIEQLCLFCLHQNNFCADVIVRLGLCSPIMSHVPQSQYVGQTKTLQKHVQLTGPESEWQPRIAGDGLAETLCFFG